MKTNHIYHEDCLKTLSKMEDDSIDLVITSPPYNMNLRIFYGKYRSRQVVKELSTKYHDFSDNLPIEDFYNFHKIPNFCIDQNFYLHYYYNQFLKAHISL